LFLISKKCATHSCKETANENKSLKNMDICVTHTLSDKAFKGTYINQALPSLHGGSIEITLTVPLNQ